MSDVILWGAKGHARVLHEALNSCGLNQVVALVDNRDVEIPLASLPVLKGMLGLTAWLEMRPELPLPKFAIAIGGRSGADRLMLLKDLKAMGLMPVTIIHRTAFVAGDAEIGEGSQILAQAAVCTHVRVGRCVIVNTAASIDHDVVLEDGVHIGPGATLAGEIRIKECAFVGAGAVVLPGLTVGRSAMVGAGAVVTRDVLDHSIVAGNPARMFRNEK